MKISERSRALYQDLAKGFNTWDLQSVTAQVLLPERLRVNVGFFAASINKYTTGNLWDQVEKFGEHSIDGSYTEVFIRFQKGIYQVETSAHEKELVIRVTPVKSRYEMYLSLEAGEMFGRTFSFRYENETIIAEQDGECFQIRCLNDQPELSWDPVTCPHLVASADQTCYFTVNSEKDAGEIDRELEQQKKKWLNSTITASGNLGEGITAMRRCLLWNMVYDFKNRRVVTPVSRNWCNRKGNGTEFGDYVLFGWDTLFAGLMFGLIDKRLAYSTVFSILEEITPDGAVPNAGCGAYISKDHSEPQVGSLCVWKLYVQYGDKWFLEECFRPLLRWNEWRFEHRDFNHDGLMELASDMGKYDETDELVWKPGNKQAAMWESGLDNSTMWDDAVFNEQYHCMELSYVGLNAMMVADCELLEKMAHVLEDIEEEKKIHARRIRLSETIEKELWDDSAECYLNKNWDGTFNSCLSMTHFYTLTAGLGRDGREEKMIRNHLLNPDEFWGKYIIPNISRSDPSFEDQDYWRGRIWAPTNFLVGEGIMRCGRKDIWDELIHKGLSLFVNCWKTRGVVGENYNAITGEAAEPNKASDRFYHWGALLVYMAVERAVNFNEWSDAVEMNALPDWMDHIRNIPVGNKKIDV